MKKELKTPSGTVRVGSRIRIVRMEDRTTPSAAFPDGIDHSAREYNSKEGTVTIIDDRNQLHGTWGGLAVNTETDQIAILAQ